MKDIEQVLQQLNEYVYPHMLGAAEIMTFYKKASDTEIKKFEDLLYADREPEAIDLLGLVLKLAKGEVRKMKKYLATSLDRAGRMQKNLNEQKQKRYWFPITFTAYIKLGASADSLEEAKKEAKEFLTENPMQIFKQSHFLKDASIEEVEEIGEPTVEENLELSEQVGFSTQGRGSKEDWVGKGIKSLPQMICGDCGAKFFPTGYGTPLNVPSGPKIKPTVVCPSCGSKNVSTVGKELKK